MSKDLCPGDGIRYYGGARCPGCEACTPTGVSRDGDLFEEEWTALGEILASPPPLPEFLCNVVRRKAPDDLS